jgi:hypothetical protein
MSSQLIEDCEERFTEEQVEEMLQRVAALLPAPPTDPDAMVAESDHEDEAQNVCMYVCMYVCIHVRVYSWKDM